MENDSMIIRLEGDSGDGIITAGEVLARAAARTGYHVFTYRTFLAVVRGGQVTYQLRLGAEKVQSQGATPDLLMALNPTAYENHARTVAKDGTIVTQPGVVEGSPDADDSTNGHLVLNVSYADIAEQATGVTRGKNIVAAGVAGALVGIDREPLIAAVRQNFERKGEKVMDANEKALSAGYDKGLALLETAEKPPMRLPKVEPVVRMLMSGNEAVAFGALAAGCRFYAGYPITPASEIMEWLAKQLPRFGGRFLQVEDEISALGMCIGAAYGGTKSMTATSGPGLSLMAELIGLASMAEIPLVIVDVQRAGPSTGMPTKDSQGDLNFAIHGSHGEAPRAVIAPHSVEDAFYQTIRAFNIAHKYHIPVILLSSQSISHRTQTIDLPDFDDLDVYDEPFFEGGKPNNGFKRYNLADKDGVSIRSVPGTRGGSYRAAGLEHNESGNPSFDPQSRNAMIERRRNKMHAIELAHMNEEILLDAVPEIGVMGWGTTASNVKELTYLLREEGTHTSYCCPHLLWPMPDRGMRQFLASGIKKLYVCELNSTRQFAELFKARYTPELMAASIEVVSITKDNGLPFSTEDLYNQIKPRLAAAKL